MIPHAVVGSYATSSVPPGSITGANKVTSGTIVATNVDTYVGETISSGSDSGSGSGSGSGSATAGAGATTTGVSTGCVELTLAASGTSTTSDTTESGVCSAAGCCCSVDVRDRNKRCGQIRKSSMLRSPVRSLPSRSHGQQPRLNSKSRCCRCNRNAARSHRQSNTGANNAALTAKISWGHRRWHRCVEGNGRRLRVALLAQPEQRSSGRPAVTRSQADRLKKSASQPNSDRRTTVHSGFGGSVSGRRKRQKIEPR